MRPINTNLETATVMPSGVWQTLRMRDKCLLCWIVLMLSRCVLRCVWFRFQLQMLLLLLSLKCCLSCFSNCCCCWRWFSSFATTTTQKKSHYYCCCCYCNLMMMNAISYHISLNSSFSVGDSFLFFCCCCCVVVFVVVGGGHQWKSN